MLCHVLFPINRSLLYVTFISSQITKSAYIHCRALIHSTAKFICIPRFNCRLAARIARRLQSRMYLTSIFLKRPQPRGRESTINRQVTGKRKSTRVYGGPIDFTSAHWNSEASVAGQKSRRCNEKALLPHRFAPRVQRPKVRRLNLRNTKTRWRRGWEGGVGAEQGEDERKREISVRLAIGNFLMHYGRVYSSRKLCSNKVERGPGTLISLRLARAREACYAKLCTLPNTAEVLSVIRRLLAGPLVNTRVRIYRKEKREIKYSGYVPDAHRYPWIRAIWGTAQLFTEFT